MNVVPDYFIYKIALVGKDDKKYGEGVHRNVDVFVVLEENNYNLENILSVVSQRVIVKKLITKQE